jgi:NitT/TauT family transport system permease protein
MKNKTLSTAKFILPLIFWLGVWEIASLIVNHSYFLPSVPDTFLALGEILSTGEFYLVVLLSIVRVLLGIVFGVLLGTVLAFLSNKSEILKAFVSPLMTVIKSTPVATIIIILWVAMSGDALAIFISVLMVTPIVWQNLLDGFSSISTELLEMSSVFEFSFASRMQHLVFPALMKYLIPALITSIGLAWKAEIAAEIIAYTKNSIGYYINDAKSAFDQSDTVFAWTLIIIVMSIILEKTTKFLISRCKI